MIDFIVYENAGKGRGAKVRDRIAEILGKKNVPYTFHYTECVGSATKITRKLCREGAKTIVAVGGDGTVHEVLNGIEDLRETTFGIIPAGTGNDFAAALGFTSAEDGLEAVLSGNKGNVDFIVCGGVRCMNIAGCGIDVDILRHYLTRRRQNKMQYFFSLIHCLIHYRPYELTLVDENGVKHEKKAFIACACNGWRFGGGIRICPVADPFDGYMDCLIVNDMPKINMLPGLLQLVSGKIIKNKNSELFHVKKFRMDGDVTLQLDGEIYTGIPFEAEVISGELKMFLSARKERK